MPRERRLFIVRSRNLRMRSTYSERSLWKMLRGRAYRNLKFRRQHPIAPYIADFYCHELRLVIELDGAYHNSDKARKYDQARDKYMKNLGLQIIRIRNRVFNSHPNILFDQIDEVIELRKLIKDKGH